MTKATALKFCEAWEVAYKLRANGPMKMSREQRRKMDYAWERAGVAHNRYMKL